MPYYIGDVIKEEKNLIARTPEKFRESGVDVRIDTRVEEVNGNAGAVSRINTLSAALWAGLTLDDVGYLDLAYAPPFGGSWDLIHIAAQVLKRQL